jgi:peptidoglycan hydrolase CwlO-like protein
MKITKEFVLLSVIAILLIINLISVNTIKTDVKKYEDKIKSLQTNVDSISKINTEINNKIITLNGDISNITNKIEKVDKTINIIKRNTDEKIRNVDNFGVNDLELFFTNRYGKK